MKPYAIVCLSFVIFTGCSGTTHRYKEDSVTKNSTEQSEIDKRVYETVDKYNSANVIVLLKKPASVNEMNEGQKLDEAVRTILNMTDGIRLKHQHPSIYGFSAEITGNALQKLKILNTVKEIRGDGFSPPN